VGRASPFLLFTAMMVAIFVLALRRWRWPPFCIRTLEVELDRKYKLVEVDDEALGDE
jgi:hypothetical protein